jgi:hypothetical protein
MYSTIPFHWNIKSAPASPGRSRAGPEVYRGLVPSLLQPVQQGRRRSPQGSPLSSGIGGGEVRGIISLAVSAGVADTASVEAVMEESSQDVQAPPPPVLCNGNYENVFLFYIRKIFCENFSAILSNIQHENYYELFPTVPSRLPTEN